MSKTMRVNAPATVFHIRKIANARGMAIRELSRRAGVTPSTFYKIDRGEAFPQFSTLWSVSRALDVSIYDLFSLPQQEGVRTR